MTTAKLCTLQTPPQAGTRKPAPFVMSGPDLSCSSRESCLKTTKCGHMLCFFTFGPPAGLCGSRGPDIVHIGAHSSTNRSFNCSEEESIRGHH